MGIYNPCLDGHSSRRKLQVPKDGPQDERQGRLVVFDRWQTGNSHSDGQRGRKAQNAIQAMAGHFAHRRCRSPLVDRAGSL